MRCCDKCGEAFNDTYGFFICTECSNCLCDDCVDETGARSLDDLDADEDDSEAYCPFCQKDEVTSDELLDFALKKLNTTYEDLLQKYRNEIA